MLIKRMAPINECRLIWINLVLLFAIFLATATRGGRSGVDRCRLGGPCWATLPGPGKSTMTAHPSAIRRATNDHQRAIS
jgi:hypothetical protein